MPEPSPTIEFEQRPDRPKAADGDDADFSAAGEPTVPTRQMGGTATEDEIVEEPADYGPDYTPDYGPEQETDGQPQGGAGQSGAAGTNPVQMARKTVVLARLLFFIPSIAYGCLIIIAITVPLAFIGWCSQEKVSCAKTLGIALFNAIFGNIFGKI